MRTVSGRGRPLAGASLVLGLVLVACGGGSPTAEQREACGQLRDLSDVLATVSFADEGASHRVDVGVEGFASAANRTDDADLRSSARALRESWTALVRTVGESRSQLTQAQQRARSAGIALDAARIDWDEILGDDGIDEPPRDTSAEEAEVTRAGEAFRHTQQRVRERVGGAVESFEAELAGAADACGSAGVPVEPPDSLVE